MPARLNIIHIEDDEDSRELVAQSLHLDPAITLTSFSSGFDAVKEALHAAPAVDLIVTDVMMPVWSGPETIDCLQCIPQLKDVPVVYLTAIANFDAAAGLHDPAGVITKPFDPLTLAARLRAIVESNTHSRATLDPSFHAAREFLESEYVL